MSFENSNRIQPYSAGGDFKLEGLKVKVKSIFCTTRLGHITILSSLKLKNELLE